MIKDRWLQTDDELILTASIEADEYHKGTPVSFFAAPNTVSKVYEDQNGPICFVRGTSALRLDVQFLDNQDIKRNMKAILAGLTDITEKARQNGYTEIVFNTKNPALAAFCNKRFGFVESEGELRSFL